MSVSLDVNISFLSVCVAGRLRSMLFAHSSKLNASSVPSAPTSDSTAMSAELYIHNRVCLFHSF